MSSNLTSKHKLHDEHQHGSDERLSDLAAKKLKHATASVSSSSAQLHPSSLFASSSSFSSLPPPSLTSASANKASFQLFVESFAPLSKEILHVQIPQKILELHKYISELPPFYPALLPPSLSSSSPSSPLAVIPITSPIPPHPLLSLLLPYLHSSLSLLLTHLAHLKLHIQLMIPPIDDSPPFSVEIQESTIAELGRHEENAFTTLERIPAYSGSRAKVLSKVVKWPGVEDYYCAVGELDQGMWVDVRQGLCEVREAYMAVWDLLTKNEERLRDPLGEEKYRHMAM